ncbi:MAG: hypothetical protein U1C51_10120 [Candidatus Izemoplasmatales bacterium]|nr:hypothetical protein [Candidatus Izemoplasmatales bacterium]
MKNWAIQRKKRKMALLFRMMMSASIVLIVAATSNLFVEAKTAGKILELVSYENAIYYKVLVAIGEDFNESDSLVLCVESQFDYQEIPLSSGEQVGLVEGLRSGVLYTVRILRNQGFGNYTIDLGVIRTTPNENSMLVIEFMVQTHYHEEWTALTGRVLLGKNDVHYEDYRLYFYIGHHFEETQEWPDRSLFESLEMADFSFQLYDLYPMNQTIYFLVEALDSSGEPKIILMEKRVIETPINASMYVSILQPTKVQLVVYLSSEMITGRYELSVMQSSKQVFFSRLENSSEQEPIHIDVGMLKQNTLYIVKLIHVSYDERLGVTTKTEVNTIEFMTPPPYTIEVQQSIDGSKVTLIIDMMDPNQILSNLYVMSESSVNGVLLFHPLEWTTMGQFSYQAVFEFEVENGYSFNWTIYGIITLDESTIYSGIIFAQKRG